MKDIIAIIDQSIFDQVGFGKFYGLCELVIDDKEANYPRTLTKPAEKVTPNDRYELAIYHRLMDSPITLDEVTSFGRRGSRKSAQTIRTIVIIDRDKSNLDISDIYESIPEKMELSGYKSVYAHTDMKLDSNFIDVFESEWGNAYKDKIQMRYKIYALEYVVDVIKCIENVCV